MATVECYTCKGEKTVYQRNPDGSQTEIVCPTCHGSGTVTE